MFTKLMFAAHTPIFLYGYCLTDVSMIEKLCQRVYFPTDPVSLSHVTAMFGILYLLLREFIATSDPLGKEHDLKAHMAVCERNFNAGLESYDVLAVPSFESILALTLGVCEACYSNSKPKEID